MCAVCVRIVYMVCALLQDLSTLTNSLLASLRLFLINALISSIYNICIFTAFALIYVEKRQLILIILCSA